jgi:hypothetical protein
VRLKQKGKARISHLQGWVATRQGTPKGRRLQDSAVKNGGVAKTLQRILHSRPVRAFRIVAGLAFRAQRSPWPRSPTRFRSFGSHHSARFVGGSDHAFSAQLVASLEGSQKTKSVGHDGPLHLVKSYN